MYHKPAHRPLVGVEHYKSLEQNPILHTSPVPSFHGQRGKQLPLSLILLITSFLDDVADISRVTRASRLLYYLNLPRLYEEITLRSYSEVRYINGTPAGFGAGSPFSMGLDGLISRNVGSYVRRFNLLGEFREPRKEEFEMGLIPDNTMMLNVVIRAAIEKMEKLEGFRWALNSNPFKTVYQGLSSKSTMASLTLRFPSDRTPRPTVRIPGIPSLKYLHLVNMDPLCYNDDPSLLLLQAKKLDVLKLEWSPRMRKEREPSTQLHHLFSQCLQANYSIPARTLAMKNLFAPKQSDLDEVVSSKTIESVTMINCVDPGDPGTVFIDKTWLEMSDSHRDMTQLRRIRIDRLDRQQAQPLAMFEGMEEVYLVNPYGYMGTPLTANGYTSPTTNGNSRAVSAGPMNGVTYSASTTSPSTPTTPASAETPAWLISIGSEYLAAISTRHGKTLKKLLLSDRWPLSNDVIRHLLKECPHLEQLGVATADNIAFLTEEFMALAPKLKAIRFLIRPDDPLYVATKERDMDTHCLGIGARLTPKDFDGLRWLGIGDLYFKIGGIVHIKDPRTKQVRAIREVKAVEFDDIKHVEIWGLDNLEL